MAFQGDLRNIGLATVLQNLQQNLQSGTLALERESLKRFIYFKEGRIAMFSSGEGSETPVGEYLVRAGKLSPADLEQAQKKRRKGTRLGGVLERGGLAAEADIKAAARQYVEEEVYELFTWADGKFDFQDGPPSDDMFDQEVHAAELALDPNPLILEAARRVDEWERINRVMGSLGDIYVMRKERQADLETTGDARLKRLAELLDGRRDVATVIRDSAMGRFTVCQALSRLVAERMVRPVSADELRKLAEQAELANNMEEAIRLMRRALDLERNDLPLRRHLAELLERAGERQEAASEYKLLANSHMDAGRTNDAIDCLRKAIALMPTDVTSRERLFQLLSESGGKTIALETGVDLAGTYSGLGLNEKARAVLERLLALNPADRQTIERKLIEAHLALGDVRAAVDILRRIAHRAMKARDYDEAGRHYEELLKLDSKDEEARKRVAEIQAGVVERLMERRRAKVRALVLAAIGLPLVILVVRELASRPAETEMRLLSLHTGVDAAQTLERAGALKVKAGASDAGAAFETAGTSFDRAAQQVQDFRAKWSWTLAARAAAGELAQWQALSARAWLAAGEAHERAGKFDEVYQIYNRLCRSPGIPAEQADQAQKSMRRLESQGLVRPQGAQP